MCIPRNTNPSASAIYICHCGTNIAGMVDVAAVAKYAATLPNVAVARNYKYMCSDPGQELIQQDIRENRLNRIVVAACSPLLHEHTFRKAAEAARAESVLLPDGEHPRAQLLGAHRPHGGDPQGHGAGAGGDRARAAPQAAGGQEGRHQPERADRGRRHRRHPRRADPGQRRQDGLPGRARADHRRAHGQVRQDLPDAGLRHVRALAQDGGGRARIRTSLSGATRK